jgi:hypothetical protein
MCKRKQGGVLKGCFMKMKNITISVLILFTLLMIGSPVTAAGSSSADAGVMTNVYFCKMIKVGNNYEFQRLLTLYTGENDFGRLTFIAGNETIDNGDYAIVQDTPTGIQIIQTMKIEPQGSETPEYVLLNLELRKEQLPVPLKVISGTGSPATPAAAATTSSAGPAGTTSAASAVPTATAKSPVSLLTLIVATGIAGLVCAMRR